MALINCPDCGAQMSNTADRCLQCNYNFAKAKKEKSNFRYAILMLSIGAILIGLKHFELLDDVVNLIFKPLMDR